MIFPLELIKRSRRGFSPLHTNACSAPVIPGRRLAARLILSVDCPAELFFGGLGGDPIQADILSVFRYHPGEPHIFVGHLYHRAPVGTPLDQIARPATEAILLVAQVAEDSAGTHYQKTAQVSVASNSFRHQKTDVRLPRGEREAKQSC